MEDYLTVGLEESTTKPDWTNAIQCRLQNDAQPWPDAAVQLEVRATDTIGQVALHLHCTAALPFALFLLLLLLLLLRAPPLS